MFIGVDNIPPFIIPPFNPSPRVGTPKGKILSSFTVSLRCVQEEVTPKLFIVLTLTIISPTPLTSERL